MKRELAGLFLVVVIVAGFSDSSLTVGLSGGSLSAVSSYIESVEGGGAQTLPYGDIGSGQLTKPNFWWSSASRESPFSNLYYPLLGWSSDDTSKWSDFAYVNGNKTRLIVGVESQKDPSFTRVRELAARCDGRIVDGIRFGQQVEALVIELPLTFVRVFAGNAYGLWSVKYVEPDVKVQAEYIPNDPYWSVQWGAQKIQTDWAWNTTKGSSGVLVAVVDTGIDYTHPDLAQNYVTGGYDWVNNDTAPMDDNGHGTHCAGIIAAATNNSIGIAGIAQVHVMAEKVLDEFGSGYWDSLARGIINATDCGAKIISMSLGGGYDSELVHDAIRYAYNHGVLIVAAAGNDDTSSKEYPAAYDEVVAVVATDLNDSKAWFSNWGEWIELAAPGVDIYSTVPGGYQNKSGTSTACPHVSGTAALAWSNHQNKSRDWIRVWLRYTADDLGVPGFDENYGYGRVNAKKAVNQTVPDHEVTLMDFKKARYDEPGVQQFINTTVMNLGASNESNVEVKLFVNGSLTHASNTGFLANGTSAKVDFMWTPATLGKYNITVYAEPVLGESITTNNVRSGWISVQHPLIRPIAGQWAAYTITIFDPYVRGYYTEYMNITYDHYVEPYVMFVIISIRYMYGYSYEYGMTVNTMDRKVEMGGFGDYWFEGWIETDITMGSTVNLLVSNATVDESRYMLYGVYPIDCWGLTYGYSYTLLNHYYYDKASGLWIATDFGSGDYRVEYRLTSTNIIKNPSYEHELAVTLDAPLYLARGNSTLFNATVFNIGSSTENNVDLSLLVGGSEAKRVTIPALQNGTSYTTSYLWTPASEATYNWSASVQPVVNETYPDNNVATRSVTVSHPLIKPVEGQYANYLIRYLELGTPLAAQSDSLTFTYLEYISPYEINITASIRYSDTGEAYSRWVVVNTFTRLVEYDSGFSWMWSLFPGWIETNVTLGSTVRIWLYNGTVVGNKVIYMGGRFIDCWEIRISTSYYTGSYSGSFWYDKASGLLLGEVESQYGYTERLELHETNVSLGFMYDHDVTMAIEPTGTRVVGGNVILNATVYNTGLSDETNVHLQLMINGAMVDRVNVDHLASCGSYSLNYSWVPTREGDYSVSAYADPLPGEEYVANNAASWFSNISSQFYRHAHIAHQWVGDEDAMDWHANYGLWFYPLQFSFQFYGQTYRYIYVSNDGYITFSSNVIIIVMGDGLTTFQNPDYGYGVNGLASMLAIAPAFGNWTTWGNLTAPDLDISIRDSLSEIHVMWYVGNKSNNSITANFEVILRADGKIQFNYGPSNGFVSATIGISDGVNRIMAEDVVDLNYIRSIVFTPDFTPPDAITDLAFGGSTEDTITLTWTAPGDDGRNGDATGYMVKYSTLGPINDSNWESATTYSQSWTPVPANSRESRVISGLSRGPRYWFAVKACDGVPNYSGVSNSASGAEAVSMPVLLAVTVTAIVVPLVMLVVALTAEARARAPKGRRKALQPRRKRASVRRRSKLHSTIRRATGTQLESRWRSFLRF